MIGQAVTNDEDGNPVDGNGNKLAVSAYQPSNEVKKLFARVQTDYQVAYTLQHRTFDEFDGMSLLQRTKLDQETFGAFVGSEWVPQQNQWRWRGRKNTARNRLIGILAHMLAAMLFPYVRAINEQDEEEEMTAQVMGILVEDHLKRAGYETKFLYIVLSALVNPAVFVGVEYVEALQRVKVQLGGGKVKIVEAVDEFLSGLNLNIIPIDELMLGDFFTGELQRQPYLLRVRRISYDEARSIYGEHKDFDYVEAGKTRLFMTGQEHQTLYDIEWTEADRNYVQEITAYYRGEDIQTTWVAGVFMGNPDDVYNTNPFQHRRMTLVGKEWISVPVYPFVKSGFEPIDPTGRFAYYKSGAFKAYWDDKSINNAYGLFQDGMALDVMKPIFLSGIAKADSTVIAPGATIGMPAGGTATPYQLGPNLVAAMNVISQNKDDLSESTQDQTQGGVAQANVTARATVIAQQNARIFLGVFGAMMARLVEDVGALTIDCVIQYSTVGELDSSVPEALGMKYKTFLAKNKDNGQELSHRIVFTDKYMGKEMSKEDIDEEEWKLYDQTGSTPEDRATSTQRIYMVNPYRFARMKYGLFVNADKIVQKSMGNDQQNDALALATLTSPVVAPYVNMENVVKDFAIKPFSDGDPDRYIKQVDPNAMLGAVMGQGGAPQGQGAPVPSPQQLPALSM